MLEGSVETAWIHFEVVADGGWFKNLLYGRQPWVEVAFVNQQILELNSGIPRGKRAEMPIVPAKWGVKSKGVWNVPVAEIEELIDWVDTCLGAASGKPDYQVTGWIDGL